MTALFLGAKLFLSKLNWQLILICVACIGILGTGCMIYNAGKQDAEQKHTIEGLNTKLDNLNTQFINFKNNTATLEDISNLKNNTNQTQYVIRDRIRDVPVKAEDRPFVNDPGLLDVADIMRDYQTEHSPK